MSRPRPSLLALHLAWFNASTWLERFWTHTAWWEYLDKTTLTETERGARDGHNQPAAQKQN
jgi:hypothetical protein